MGPVPLELTLISHSLPDNTFNIFPRLLDVIYEIIVNGISGSCIYLFIFFYSNMAGDITKGKYSVCFKYYFLDELNQGIEIINFKESLDWAS